MKTEQYLKKKVIVFIAVTILLGFLILLTGLFLHENKIVQSNFIIKYGFSKDHLNILNYPLEREEGRMSSPSNLISIKNKTDETRSFQIVVDTENTDIFDKFYYSIDEQEPQKLKNILYEDQITGGAILNMDLKVWLGLDLIDNDDQDNNYQFTIFVKEK